MGKHCAFFLSVFFFIACTASQSSDSRSGIQVFDENPRYWQYDGQPVILLGATDDDNLYQWTGTELTDHLNLLVESGGNYIRNTMSARDSGNVQPFMQMENGVYDLEKWNDEYWDRFENLLKETASRDVIVQVEFWAFHDLFDEFWQFSPWNPVNNVNYDTVQSDLASAYENNFETEHDFFFSIPGFNDDTELLKLQRRYFEKILSYTMNYDHILYCITNEIFPQYPHEWGWYWADVIRQHAGKAGRQVNITEMYWQTDFTHEQHLGSVDHPEIYDFFEGSQNSAREGEENWENLQHIYGLLADNSRPINNVKIYGSEAGISWTSGGASAVDRFWRNMIGGSASSRFHRPPHGLGLSETAAASLRSMRMLLEEYPLMDAKPDASYSLLSARESNEAYASVSAGDKYAIYFPARGEVSVNVPEGDYIIRWLDINASNWTDRDQISTTNGAVTISTPEDKKYIALISKN